MIPRVYMAGIAVALVGVLCLSSYVAGRKAVRGEMAALKQSYEVAAAQSAAREAERVRMWTQASKVAGEKYDERAKMADSNFDSNLDRLRNAYRSVKGVRFTAPLPESVRQQSDRQGPSYSEWAKPLLDWFVRQIETGQR